MDEMDYLDPAKDLRIRISLFTGYVLVAIAIAAATMVLLYQAYGFGLKRDGTVIQSGLTFFSSQPNPADIYVNGKRKDVQTNTRLVLPSGVYDITLAREGYRDWKRQINLSGGHVEHYDYPFLFPKTLTTKKLQALAGAPGLSTQSPDRRWLLIQKPGALTSFIVYDLKNPTEAAKEISLPSGIVPKATGAETWKLGEWADDNKHVLLNRTYDGKTDFLMVNRDDPTQSLNLNSTLSLNPTKLTLDDRKFDRYYLYDAATAELKTVSIKETTPKSRLKRVLAYKTYSDDTILYVTDSSAPAGQTLVRLARGQDSDTIRRLPANTSYVVDLAGYDGDLYVAAGAASDNRVYIYKDPVGQLKRQPEQVPVPTQVLHAEQVNYLSFSANAQFIVAENGNRFGVYDIENETGYNYITTEPVDAPQINATWMDGNRLMYVSGGKLLVFDYDNTNHQTLTAFSSSYLPTFGPDFKFVYGLAPSVGGQLDFNQTPLLTSQDQ